MIRIAHLYYDLMNLNGENGNVVALKKHFERQNEKVAVYFLTIDDQIDFNKYDIYYIGTGSKENKLIVLNDILKYKKDIKNSINNNKYFFITGTSIELFGKYILNLDTTKTNCLGVFDYYTEEFTDEFDEKIVGEQVCRSRLIKEDIIGFQNRFTSIKNNTAPFFDVVSGHIEKEGFTYNNFYSTYLYGPLFIRNPYLTDYFVKKILEENNKIYQEFKDTFEYKAYHEYINNFVKN